jgi:hypothetical protein
MHADLPVIAFSSEDVRSRSAQNVYLEQIRNASDQILLKQAFQSSVNGRRGSARDWREDRVSSEHTTEVSRDGSKNIIKSIYCTVLSILPCLRATSAIGQSSFVLTSEKWTQP